VLAYGPTVVHAIDDIAKGHPGAAAKEVFGTALVAGAMKLAPKAAPLLSKLPGVGKAAAGLFEGAGEAMPVVGQVLGMGLSIHDAVDAHEKHNTRRTVLSGIEAGLFTTAGVTGAAAVFNFWNPVGWGAGAIAAVTGGLGMVIEGAKAVSDAGWFGDFVDSNGFTAGVKNQPAGTLAATTTPAAKRELTQAEHAQYDPPWKFAKGLGKALGGENGANILAAMDPDTKDALGLTDMTPEALKKLFKGVPGNESPKWKEWYGMDPVPEPAKTIRAIAERLQKAGGKELMTDARNAMQKAAAPTVVTGGVTNPLGGPSNTGADVQTLADALKAMKGHPDLINALTKNLGSALAGGVFGNALGYFNIAKPTAADDNNLLANLQHPATDAQRQTLADAIKAANNPAPANTTTLTTGAPTGNINPDVAFSLSNQLIGMAGNPDAMKSLHTALDGKPEYADTLKALDTLQKNPQSGPAEIGVFDAVKALQTGKDAAIIDAANAAAKTAPTPPSPTAPHAGQPADTQQTEPDRAARAASTFEGEVGADAEKRRHWYKPLTWFHDPGKAALGRQVRSIENAAGEKSPDLEREATGMFKADRKHQSDAAYVGQVETTLAHDQRLLQAVEATGPKQQVLQPQ
jgi:hypothetical protein